MVERQGMMKNLTTSLLLLTTILVVGGCAGGGGINLHDGNWANCTVTEKDGTITKAPMYTGGLPVARTRPDGAGVDCVPIPKKEPAPNPT